MKKFDGKMKKLEGMMNRLGLEESRNIFLHSFDGKSISVPDGKNPQGYHQLNSEKEFNEHFKRIRAGVVFLDDMTEVSFVPGSLADKVINKGLIKTIDADRLVMTDYK